MADKPKITLTLKSGFARILLALLARIRIKGATNVHKSRLQGFIATQLDEFEKERVELIKEYGVLDEQGEPVSENGNYKLKDQAGFEAAFKKLQDELDVVVDGSNDDLKQGCLQVCRDLLLGDACPELSPEESMAFLPILDAFVEVKSATKEAAPVADAKEP